MTEPYSQPLSFPPIVRANGKWLAKALTTAGRAQACEVRGCETGAPLEVHHIIPFGIAALMYQFNDRDQVHSVPNLAFLCRDHHALIERFYWWSRILVSPPEIARLHKEVVAIARAFRDRTVPASKIEETKTYSEFAWKQLNTGAVHNPLWWKATYTGALKWAQHQEILRTVAPAQALVSEPWFRDHRGHNSIESEDHHGRSKQQA